MTPSQALADQRGYLFHFPTLGLPDLSGDWHVISAAIGLKEIATPGFFSNTSQDKRRYVSDGCGLIEVEYEGAVWILPLLNPQKASPQAERFLVKARRERLLTMPSRPRVKAFDGAGMVMVAHPTDLSDFAFNKAAASKSNISAPSTSPYEAKEKEFWSRHLTSVFSPNVPDDSPLLLCSGFSAKLELTNDRNDAAEDRLQWSGSPDAFLDQDWVTETAHEALEAATRANVPLASLEPGMAFRSGGTGGRVRMEYAVLVTQGQEPREQDWKVVPARAFKPGKELLLVNQAREKFGKRPITQRKLERQRGPL